MEMDFLRQQLKGAKDELKEAVLKTHQLTLFQKLETAESPKVTHT